jgi:hypothetical protein
LTTFHPYRGIGGYSFLNATINDGADLRDYFNRLYAGGYYPPRNRAWEHALAASAPDRLSGLNGERATAAPGRWSCKGRAEGTRERVRDPDIPRVPRQIPGSGAGRSARLGAIGWPDETRVPPGRPQPSWRP